MNLKGLIILTSTLLSVALTVTGGYIAIDNLVNPQGYLFEGTIMAAVGMLGVLMVVIASSIGQAIMTFGKIYEKQIEISQEIQELQRRKQNSGPSSIMDLFKGMKGGPEGPPSSITITDLNTGETETTNLGDDNMDSLGRINDIIRKATEKYAGKNKSMDDMSLEELEKELSNAVKKDNYEKAAEIREKIKEKKNHDDSEDDDIEKM